MAKKNVAQAMDMANRIGVILQEVEPELALTVLSTVTAAFLMHLMKVEGEFDGAFEEGLEILRLEALGYREAVNSLPRTH